jgi:hypothetical protein
MASRNGKSDLSTEIRLDHRERKIHSGGDPRRGPDAAIFYVDGIAVDQHRRPEPLQSFNLTPMSCCPSAVQGPGRR